MTVTTQTTHNTAQTQRAEAAGVEFAYRRFGRPSDLPLVMLQHFRGNLDNWDPALTDALAAEREVILVDYPGVGSSRGEFGPKDYDADLAQRYGWINRAISVATQICSARACVTRKPRGGSGPRSSTAFRRETRNWLLGTCSAK